MFLIHKSHLPSSFSPFRGKPSVPNNFDHISRSFDENLLRRLKTLNPPSVSLSWLSLAVDFLASTHVEAQTLISNMRFSCSSDESLALYMDHSVKLLDICNSISSEIERLRQRRLLINFILHLLQFADEGSQIPAPEKLRKARDSLTDWLNNNSPGFAKRRGFQILDPEVLIGDLAAGLGSAPRGKINTADKLFRRTVYAVGLATVFIAGVLVSALYRIPDTAKVRVPAEFLWADSFNDLQSAIFAEINERRSFEGGERKGLLAELDDMTTRAVGVRDVVVLGGRDKVEKVSFERAVKELATATVKFSGGLDRLSNSVNGMFNSVLSTRSGVMEGYRAGHQ